MSPYFLKFGFHEPHVTVEVIELINVTKIQLMEVKVSSTLSCSSATSSLTTVMTIRVGHPTRRTVNWGSPHVEL